MARSADPMVRMVQSLREETLDVILEQPLAGRAVEVQTPAGTLEAWLHAAPGTPGVATPVVFEFHGGGYALGDARKEDALCEWVAQRYGVQVVGVNYRLAPEHPFPAAPDDAVAVVRHVAAHASEYGIDPQRMYAMGYSAGANLAVVTALRLAGAAGAGEPAGSAPSAAAPQLAGLLLYYPSLDASCSPQAKQPRAIDLPVELMEAFNRWYVADADPRNPLISPVCATEDQLACLPRTVMYPVEGDALYDEALSFAARLRDAGRPVEVHPVVGAYHGFVEDAANPRVYRETNYPEIIEARPADAPRIAASVLQEGLALLLGTAGDPAVRPLFTEG